MILFNSTFTKRLNAAPALLNEITTDIAHGTHYWLLTLHPKCTPTLFDHYRALAGANARFIKPEKIIPAQHTAKVLLSNTSSIVSEFIIQHKPIVTFRNHIPQPHILNFQQAEQLPQQLVRALAPNAALRSALASYADAIHPYRDEQSSERVIAATEDFIAGKLGGLHRKPLGAVWRGLQIRRELGYWGPAQR